MPRMATSKRRARYFLPLSVAIFISVFLATAALGKFLYPAPSNPKFDMWVSGIEALLIAPLMLFRMRWQMWCAASQMFAFYAGYSVFWLMNKLPCGCMGAKWQFPTSLSFSLDVLFFFFSMSMAQYLYVSRKATYAAILSGAVVAFLAYGFAEWITKR